MTTAAAAPVGSSCRGPGGPDGGTDAGDATAPSGDAGSDANEPDASEPDAADASADARGTPEDGAKPDAGDGGVESGSDSSIADGGAVDPLALSASSLRFRGGCGGQPTPPGGDPHGVFIQTFTIANTSSAPVTWTADVVGAAFTLDVSGGTLAPGATASVQVTPIAIPAVPSSFAIARGTIHVRSSAADGTPFVDSVRFDESLVGCLAPGEPTSIDFGDVPYKTTKTIDVPFTPTCGDTSELLENSVAGDSAFTTTTTFSPWTVTFFAGSPGPRTATLRVSAVGAGLFCTPGGPTNVLDVPLTANVVRWDGGF